MFHRRNRIVLAAGIAIGVIAAMSSPAGARVSAAAPASTPAGVNVTGSMSWTFSEMPISNSFFTYTGADTQSGTFRIDLTGEDANGNPTGDASTYSVTDKDNVTATAIQTGCTTATTGSFSGGGSFPLTPASGTPYLYAAVTPSNPNVDLIIGVPFTETQTETFGGPSGCSTGSTSGTVAELATPECLTSTGGGDGDVGVLQGTYPQGTVALSCSDTYSGGGATGSFSITGTLTVGGQSCQQLVSQSVSVALVGTTGIYATFEPDGGLANAAKLCNVQGFNWQQIVTSLPAPSPYTKADGGALTAPFNDPPPGGYNYHPDDAYPFYYDAAELASNTDDDTSMSFFDQPADPCLPGGAGAGCGGKTAPAGSHLSFTTSLVGVDQAGQPVGLGAGSFSWNDTFNGTSGGIGRLNSLPIDPGSGTGGITITNLDGATLTNTVPTQTITFTSTPPTPAVFGGSYRPSASGGASGNPVVFSIDSSSGAGVCSLNSGTVSFTGAGVCVIDANQAGSASYLPAPEVQQKLTVGYTRTITGTHYGPLILTAGQSVLLAAGARVFGPVIVRTGAALDVEGATIIGLLRADGATAIRACNATIVGPVALADGGGPVLLGGISGAPCGEDAIFGPVTLSGNTGGVVVAGNAISGRLSCSGNSPAPTDGGQPNTVSGPATGQCSALAAPAHRQRSRWWLFHP